MLRIIFLLVLVTSSTACADQKRDGPLGIYMGMPINELDYELGAGIAEFEYVLNEIPNPNPFIWIVVVTAPPELGVCEFWAGTEVLTDEQVAVISGSFLEDFSKAYGYPIEPIIDLEGNYEARWESTDSEQLPHNLARVIFSKWLHDSNRNPELPEELRWWVNILFTFKNTESCPNKNIDPESMLFR